MHLFNVSERQRALAGGPLADSKSLEHQSGNTPIGSKGLAYGHDWDSSRPKMTTRPQQVRSFPTSMSLTPSCRLQAGYVKVLAALPASGPHLKKLVEALSQATEIGSINVVNLIASYLVGEVFLRR